MRALAKALMCWAGLGIGYAQAGTLDGVDALKIPVTARVLSLGGLGTMAQGAEAVFYNPAGLAGLARPSLHLTHVQLIDSVRLDAFSLGYPHVNGLGQLGVSFISLSPGRIEGRDEAGRPAGSFGASDSVLGLAWSHGVSSRLFGRGRLGLGVKHVRQRIADSGADGLAFDAGLQGLGLSMAPEVSMGLSVQNLGPRMRLAQESYPLPLTWTGGVAYSLRKAVTLQLGASHRPYGGKTSIVVGTEASLGSFSLRSGYMNLLGGSGTLMGGGPAGAGDFISKLALGLGWKVLKGALRLDYAFQPMAPDMGNSHRVSLGLEFGSAEPLRKPRPMAGARSLQRRTQRRNEIWN